MFRKYRVQLGMCLLAAASLIQAQQAPPPAQNRTQSGAAGQGTFFGQLTGAGMDGATVTATNVSTGQMKTATADQNGAFTLADLTPGQYRISVKLKSGLQIPESTIQIGTGNQVAVQFPPEAGTPAAALTLEARTPTLQTDTAEVSRDYDSSTIRELPIIDRQNEELVTLMPGVSPPVVSRDRVSDPQRTRAFNVNGQPSYINLYNQDGAYDNEPFFGRPLRVEPDEAVQELGVRTSNYNAEYGVSGGSWASTITRPGTNVIHGSLFEFNTNNYFRTGREYYSSKNTPRFNVNQFGGTAGGPLVPDDLFWFVSYEGYLQRGYQEQVATVPTAALAAGNFAGTGATIYASPTPTGTTRVALPFNTIPPASINRTSAQLLSLLPAPNLPGLANNLVGAARLLDDTHRMDGKLDQRYSDRLSGFLRYGFTEASVDQGSVLGPVGNPLTSAFRAMNAVGDLTYSLTTSLLTELRFGYDRYRNQIAPWNTLPGGVPSVTIAGFSSLGAPADVPSKQIDNIYDGANQWIWHKGINSFKLGFDIRSLQVNGIANPFFSSLGSFTFGPGSTLLNAGSAAALSPTALAANSLAGFLLGAPNQAGITTYTLNPAYRQMQYGAYAVDTVNLFQRVWLEIGVRYDIFSPISPEKPGGAVLYNQTSNTITPVGQNGLSSNIYRYDIDNVAPRVGLAFRPANRFVFRAGYGILYYAEPFMLSPFNPASRSFQSGIAGAISTTSFAIPTGPTGTVTTAPNTPFFISPRTFQTPYLETYSGMVQGDLGNGFLLDIGYVGNVGRQLPYSVPLVGAPGSGLAGLPVPGRTASIVQIGTGLTSNYNSLQVNLTKKFAAGLAFTGAYTYGKALDYGYNLLNPYNRRANYGPADWDRTHVLSLSHIWRLPFGVNQKYFTSGMAARILGDWEFNGIYRWATGTPYTVTTDPTACGCLGLAAVPANYSGPPITGGATFNPSLFTTPVANSFGNLSRNSFRGPTMSVYNLALFKNFAATENIKIELRGEAYNLLNSTNPMNPVNSFTEPGFGTSLGNINGLAGRQFQVAVRALF